MSAYLFDGHPEPVTSVAFEPSGDRIATADAGGRIKLWSGADAAHIRDLRDHEPHDHPRLFWHPSVGLIVLRIQAPCELWDVEQGRIVELIKIPVSGVRVPSPSGRWIGVLGHDRPFVWDVEKKRVVPLFQRGLFGLWQQVPKARRTRRSGKRKVARPLESAPAQILAYHFASSAKQVIPEGEGSCGPPAYGEQTMTSLSADGIVCTWNLETGRCIRTLRPNWAWLPLPSTDYVRFVDSEQVAVVRLGSDEVHVWSTWQEPPLRRLKLDRKVVAVAVADCGSEFSVATDDGRIHRWVTASLQPLGILRPNNRQEFSAIGGLQYSARADKLAAVTGRPGTVEVYCLNQPQPRATLMRQSYRWWKVSAQPRELKILLCGRHSVLQWDLDDNNRRLRWRSSAELLLSASAPGGWILTATEGHELLVRNLNSKACLWGPVVREAREALQNDDRSRLVVFGEQSVETWGFKGERQHTQQDLGGIVFSHTAAMDCSGRWLVWSGAESATLNVGVFGLDLQSGRNFRIPVEAHAIPNAVSSHGVAALPTFAGVHLWNLETNTDMGLLPYEGALASRVVFDNKGRHVAVVLPDSIQVWDVAHRKMTAEIWEEEVVDEVVFAAAGRLLIGTVEGLCRIWCLEHASTVCTLACFTESHGWLVYTPDGRFDGSEEAEAFLRADAGVRLRREPDLLHTLMATYHGHVVHEHTPVAAGVQSAG